MIASNHHMPIVVSIKDKVLNFLWQFRFDKRWICEDGLMESIECGWSTQRGGPRMGIVDKIHNCRHEISVWRKENPPHGKEKINTLQRALEDVQSDLTKSHEEVIEVSRKLKEAYRD